MTAGRNTILVTGGGSGIGLGLAAALHAVGHKVIIAGRRRAALDAAEMAYPGIATIELDVADSASIRAGAADLRRDHPSLDITPSRTSPRSG